MAAGCRELAQCTIASMYLGGKRATRDHWNSQFHHQPRAVNTTEEKQALTDTKGTSHCSRHLIGNAELHPASTRPCCSISHAVQSFYLSLCSTEQLWFWTIFSAIKIKLPIQCLCYKRSQNYIYSSFYFHDGRCACLEDRVIQRPFLCYCFIICVLCRLLIQGSVRCARQIKHTSVIRLCKNKHKRDLVSF